MADLKNCTNNTIRPYPFCGSPGSENNILMLYGNGEHEGALTCADCLVDEWIKDIVKRDKFYELSDR